jgi:hypothetical protein
MHNSVVGCLSVPTFHPLILLVLLLLLLLLEDVCSNVTEQVKPVLHNAQIELYQLSNKVLLLTEAVYNMAYNVDLFKANHYCVRHIVNS